MKIIYTNISPVTNSYTNINHLFHLKKQNPQKVYLCIWDKFVFENKLFNKTLKDFSDKEKKLKENVKVLEKILDYLEIDYKIIYLSEAMKRLFQHPIYLSNFQDILSNIKLEELKKGFELEYIPFNEISLSKINYIISDYLIALNLEKLFPELCSSSPNNYLTSERFKIFYSKIDKSLRINNLEYTKPKLIFVKGVPIICDSKKDLIPNLEMSIEDIKRIIKEHYSVKPSLKEFEDTLEVLSMVNNEFLVKEEMVKRNKINLFFNSMNYEEYMNFISNNFYRYFTKINKIISEKNVKKQDKNIFISNYEDFNNKVKSLNNIKLRILQYCNGNNTSLDISKQTGLKLSTVSTYLTHLKNKEIISQSKKPKKLIDNFVINLNII